MADLGDALLRLARCAIVRELGRPGVVAAAHPRLDAPGATFVTLMAEGALRGCIGSLEPVRMLRADVEHNARHAAFADPRFPPVGEGEIEAIEVEVSLIGATEALTCSDEDDLLAQLRPGVDGLTLRHGRQRGTFLPQVWEALPDPQEFLRELKRKAGLPAGFWSAGIAVERYAVTQWSESKSHGNSGASQRSERMSEDTIDE